MKYMAIVALSFFLGWFYADKKEFEATYGETGLPKNCIAIVQEAANKFRAGQISPVDAMNSIERNCGKYGYSLKL